MICKDKCKKIKPKLKYQDARSADTGKKTDDLTKIPKNQMKYFFIKIVSTNKSVG